tara:strand:+ start:181 stop:840 length:660 start_codon:yes stop_codon:yes gene_type:complete
MNINFEKARNLMVENQLRPNRIKEKSLLNLFKTVPKEVFVPDIFKANCYFDKDLNILQNRGYLKNLHLAQIIDCAKIQGKNNVLHIGGLTGYLSLIISKLCKKITILEEDKTIYENLKKNIEDFNIENIEILNTKLSEGCLKNSPYDIIIIDCPLYYLNNDLIEQVNPKNGKLIYIEKVKDNLSKAYKITRNDNFSSKEYLFDVFSNFSIDQLSEEFKF